MPKFDPLFVQFVYYFNVKKDFYECHEVLEELWMEEGRPPIIQGLLQAAVALYHFSYGNVSGAKKLFTGALQKLSAYNDEVLGIQLKQFRNDCETYLARLEQYDEYPFDFYTFSIQMIDRELQKRVESIS